MGRNKTSFHVDVILFCRQIKYRSSLHASIRPERVPCAKRSSFATFWCFHPSESSRGSHASSLTRSGRRLGPSNTDTGLMLRRRAIELVAMQFNAGVFLCELTFTLFTAVEMTQSDSSYELWPMLPLNILNLLNVSLHTFARQTGKGMMYRVEDIWI